MVRVRTDEGITGVAEATPRPTVYSESHRIHIHAIKKWSEPMLMSLDPAYTEKIWGKLNTIKWNPTAKGAIDLARYDTVAQARNLPLWEIAGRIR